MSNKRKKEQLREEHQAKEERKAAREREEMIRTGRIILAEIPLQPPEGSWCSPRTEYRDVEFICCDCGTKEVWTAKQQQWWYEVAKGPFYSDASRCAKCRASRRKYKGLAPKTIAEREAHEREQDQDQS